jgi:RNA recognition motif-containing protein
MNIYVSNISVKIILDKETQRSRGFGFVEMPDETAAKQAMNELNGYNFQGKELMVNEARPKTDNPRGGGGGGYGNRGGGGGGYGNRGGGGGGGFNKKW